MKKPVIYLAADHAGFEMKNAVCEWLAGEGYAVEDCGATVFDEHDDFPEYIQVAAAAVAPAATDRRAIIFGGSGQGEAMQANRFAGVRAAVFYGGPEEIVTLSRQHNDANVLSLGARFISIDKAKEMIWLWLHTEALSDKKYHRRNAKLDHFTEKNTDGE